MDRNQADIYENGEDIDDSMFDDPEDYVDEITDEGNKFKITCTGVPRGHAFNVMHLT